MSVLVVGSVALDSVATPFGAVEEALGGSACYFSTSASFFSDVQLVAVIGDDFPEEHIDFLASRNIDLSGLQRSPGETFRWKGRYAYDLNEAQTLDTRLNVFEQFRPVLSALHREAEYVFLANIDPELQLEVLQQVKKPKLVACDTMNFWIGSKREALINTLGYVDILIINEAEVRQLADEPNLIKAAEIVRAFGPKTLVVKRGEYGVLMFTEHGQYEYGSPKRPKILEAVILSFIDDLDSKINGIQTHIDKEPARTGDWTGYHRLYDRYFYAPLEPQDAAIVEATAPVAQRPQTSEPAKVYRSRNEPLGFTLGEKLAGQNLPLFGNDKKDK